MFQGDAGADTGEQPTETPTVDPNRPSVPEDAQQRARNFLDEAQSLFEAADAALKSGDLADYQAKVQAAEAKIAEAAEALG